MIFGCLTGTEEEDSASNEGWPGVSVVTARISMDVISKVGLERINTQWQDLKRRLKKHEKADFLCDLLNGGLLVIFTDVLKVFWMHKQLHL